jgi:hypothetical protein
MDNSTNDNPEDFLEYVKSITNKRAKIVIDHILKNGFITTEELEVDYKYNHAPRAARDVREAGIELVTFKVKSRTGKSIAAYKFGDYTTVKKDRLAGRIAFSKKFKTQLFEKFKGRCSICNGEFEERYLQIDHRVPYQVGGDVSTSRSEGEYMLLCGSCNRSKSWSCEHCKNWLEILDPFICLSCYWGTPLSYTHIAMDNVRRIDIQWTKEEVEQYDQLKQMALERGITIMEVIKTLLPKSR